MIFLVLRQKVYSGVVLAASSSLINSVPDRGCRHGGRHPLVVILVLTACASLVMSTTIPWRRSGSGRWVSQERLHRIGTRLIRCSAGIWCPASGPCAGAGRSRRHGPAGGDLRVRVADAASLIAR